MCACMVHMYTSYRKVTTVAFSSSSSIVGSSCRFVLFKARSASLHKLTSDGFTAVLVFIECCWLAGWMSAIWIS